MCSAAIGDLLEHTLLLGAVEPGEIEPIDPVARKSGVPGQGWQGAKDRRQGKLGGKEQRPWRCSRQEAIRSQPV
ncbi:hypothetical protein D9M72_486420 [compost metagenome]